MADPKQSRGYRNCNPGNIDWSARNDWQGQTGMEKTGSPPRFATFESHEYGIRALAALLTTYQDRHGLRRIREIIGRWAPGAENDTGAYVRHVAALTGKPAETVLDLHEYEDLRPLVEAIITHECGGNPYPSSTIDAGLRLAGVPRPVTNAAEAVHTPMGEGAITVGTVSAVAAALVPLIQALAGAPWWLGTALVAGAALVATAYVLNKRAGMAL